MNDFIDALQNLALSPVKEDTKVISRLESKYGKPINVILEELQESAIIEQSFQEKPKKSDLISRIIMGLFVSSMLGIIGLFIRPEIVKPAMILGFVAGICEPREGTRNNE